MYLRRCKNDSNDFTGNILKCYGIGVAGGSTHFYIKATDATDNNKERNVFEFYSNGGSISTDYKLRSQNSDIYAVESVQNTEPTTVTNGKIVYVY